MEWWKIVTTSAAETQRLGSIFAHLSNPGDVLTLEGALGSGKTTFTQGFAKGLGIPSVVNSPTFVIFKIYAKGRLPLYHMDAYRLEGKSEDLGFHDYIYGAGVTLIEWPSYVSSLLPDAHFQLIFRWLDDTHREIMISATTKDLQHRLEEVQLRWKNSSF